jgi:GDP-L-fucose synthase
MENKTRTYVAGHTGLVGSALWRRLSADNGRELVSTDLASLDLRRQTDTEKFFEGGKIGLFGRGQGGRHSGQQHI